MAAQIEASKASAAPKTPANTPNSIKFLIGGVAGYSKQKEVNVISNEFVCLV